MKHTKLSCVKVVHPSIQLLSVAVLLIAVAALLSGCGLFNRGPKPPTPGPSTPRVQPKPNNEKPLTQTDELSVYFLRGEKIASAKRNITSEHPLQAQATALVAELLAGPNDIETEFGLGTTIPPNTKVLGVEVDGDEATVDFNSEFESGGGSLSMQLRVAQVVWTLTQLEDINRVSFALDGKVVEAIGGEGIMVSPALTREDCEDQAPAILVEFPAVNQEVKSPLVVSGSSNTFEASLMVDIVDPEGLILKTVPIMATSGTGTRGTFEESIPFETTRSGLGAIIFYESSAKDGKPINIVEIPVRMTP